MRAVLVRVGIDQAYGHWNAPVDPGTHEFVYVPIPDGKDMGHGLATPYSSIGDALAGFARGRVVDRKACALPSELLGRNMHLDPDFKWLTYGNNPNTRGAHGLPPDEPACQSKRRRCAARIRPGR